MPPHSPKDPGRQFAEPVEKTPELIRTLLENSSQVMVKKLANNDRNWAIWDENKGKKGDYKSHQGGVLLPADARERDFFPPLSVDADKPHNLSTDIEVYWPATGKIYDSRFIWYSDKGAAENHWTWNPRSEFSQLAPASFVLLFKPNHDSSRYNALTVDSADEALCSYLDEVFGIEAPGFSYAASQSDALDLSPTLTALQHLVKQLAEELAKSPKAFSTFIRSLSKRSADDISLEAYNEWQQVNGNMDLNPYRLESPGDVLNELTRVREFAIYKREEASYYGPRLAEALYGNGRNRNVSDAVTFLVENFEVIYQICLSAGQTRKTRAGGSFETHVARMLRDGDVPHSPQLLFNGRKPDFVLPSKKLYLDINVNREQALVLALKTTLRERWTQVLSESTGCPIFLATLDEGVPKATLDKLSNAAITLVVPESFKTSKYAEYQSHSSVVTFKNFFKDMKTNKHGLWTAAGISCFKT
jgi:hypothetical protein